MTKFISGYLTVIFYYVTSSSECLYTRRRSTVSPSWCVSLRPENLKTVRPQIEFSPFFLELQIYETSANINVSIVAKDDVATALAIYVTAVDKMENKLGNFLSSSPGIHIVSCNYPHIDAAYVINGSAKNYFLWSPRRPVKSVMFIATVVYRPTKYWILRSEVFIPTPKIDSSEETRLPFRTFNDTHTLTRLISNRRHVPFLLQIS
ncbi:unnamed protein product [Allacma fusca]|uniref:Reelin domain-containing protein n=1 Tax=Allacma fusca TaxID=39272 RepID=A0A8J2JQ87_9HEXA|nr:unnamed protein product [Allacma fusca]